MGKRPFIDRKTAKHYQLVHRSQRDPLINDSEASSRVLVEVKPANQKGRVHISQSESEDSGTETERHVGQAALYGIYYDETEYDYMQHLKPIGVDSTAIFIEASPQKHEKKEKKQLKFVDELSIELPSEVLPSKEEIPIGVASQSAIPDEIRGFQPDMDPSLREALEALEDEAYIQNDLDDEFFAELNTENYPDSEEDNRDIRGERDDYDVRSQMTGYSMSSSAMYRNEKLTLLDEQFEKIEEEYMDNDYDEDDEQGSQDRQDFEQIMNEFLDKYEIVGKKMVPKLEGNSVEEKLETIRSNLRELVISNDLDEGRMEQTLLDVSQEERHSREAWDCQSILSTYSNLDNHPSLIREQSRRKIKINPVTGMPIISDESKKTEDLKVLVTESDEADCETQPNKMGKGAARSRNESKEEKKNRKELVKVERRNRRAEKKSTKQAFSAEKTKQSKIAQIRQSNLVGSMHLD